VKFDHVDLEIRKNHVQNPQEQERGDDESRGFDKCRHRGRDLLDVRYEKLGD
jgi:hypothetical protein